MSAALLHIRDGLRPGTFALCGVDGSSVQFADARKRGSATCKRCIYKERKIRRAQQTGGRHYRPGNMP